MWKTSLCSYFRRSEGSCSHGDGCRYAHGEEELRPRPGNTWDPTSERAKKMLKSENGENSKAVEGGGGGGDVMMMTDALDGDVLDGALAKCLVNLPMKWSSDNLRTFLSDQVIFFFVFFAFFGNWGDQFLFVTDKIMIRIEVAMEGTLGSLS